MALPSLKVIVTALVLLLCSVIVAEYLYIRSLHDINIKQAEVITQQRAQISALSKQLDDISTQRNTIEDALRRAETERNEIRSELAKTLTKLRTQKPPVDCKAAVDWAVENKGDLQW